MTPRRRIVLALFLGLALASIAAACGGREKEDPDQITVYSGREEEYAAAIIKQFEKDTGKDVKVRYGDSAELAATLAEEGDNSPADVFWSQDAGSLGAVEKEGLLTNLSKRTLEPIPSRYRSEDGKWVGISGRARIVGYNRDNVKESELPDSILDYTDPRWKGRIGWAPTNGSFQAFVTALRKVEGEDVARKWLEGIVENKPQSYENNELLRDAIASDEVDVGFLNHYYVAEAIAEEGKDYPVGINHPPNGDVGSLVNVAGAGIVKSARNPNGGQEFIDYLNSRKGQRYWASEIKEYPLVKGVKADPSLEPLDTIQQPDVKLAELTDLKGTLKLIEDSGAL